MNLNDSDWWQWRLWPLMAKVGCCGDNGYGWLLWRLWLWLVAVAMVGCCGDNGYGWLLW